LVDKNIINIKSTYIDASSDMLKKEENSRIYNKNEILNLFRSSGFKIVSIFSDFKQNSYVDGVSDKLVAIFRR